MAVCNYAVWPPTIQVIPQVSCKFSWTVRVNWRVLTKFRGSLYGRIAEYQALSQNRFRFSLSESPDSKESGLSLSFNFPRCRKSDPAQSNQGLHL